MSKKVKFTILFALLAAVVTVVLCACSNKSSSSSKPKVEEASLNTDFFFNMPTKGEKETHETDELQVSTQTSDCKSTTSVTAYVVGTTTSYVTTTKSDVSKGNLSTKSTQTTTRSNGNNPTVENTESTSNLPIVTTTSKQAEKVITTTLKNEVTTNVNTGNNTTERCTTEIVTTTNLQTYTPNLYVEVSPYVTDYESRISEYDMETFQTSATLWFQNEEELNKVARVINPMDEQEIGVNEKFDFNDYLSENSLKEEDRIEYFASVLIFECSKAAKLQIIENSFPELNDFYEDSKRLSRNGENLILTNNTKNTMVIYVYVNTYSQSITVSLYASNV